MPLSMHCLRLAFRPPRERLQSVLELSLGGYQAISKRRETCWPRLVTVRKVRIVLDLGGVVG